MNIKQLIIIASFVVLYTTANAASITGTPHDLSDKNYGSTETCKFCHIPHNANANGVSPLWNRNIPQTQYKIYNSEYRKTESTQPTLSAQTRLCLSCHDGTQAMDIGQGSHLVSNPSKIITLSTDHPVSVAYANNPILVPAKFKQAVSDKSVDASMQLPLYSGNLECGTCHNPHDNTFGKFLRISNDKSQLCVTCHNM